jgi:outer membrane protein OmpA-like peptidoglycan-associated protein
LVGNLNKDVAEDNYPYEDIYFATRNFSDSTQPVAQNIGQPINTLYHDSNVGLSKDGTRLFIYKDDNEGDIFEARIDELGNWSEPKPLGKHVNTEYSETTVTLSPDGQTLFFASNRKGGFGGLDIWVTHKDKKGEWGDAENLGEEINTSLNEDGPFIGYDSKTLYFSSEGGEGMGGYDIYRVVYDSLSSAWEAPENMGYPINTPDHDIYFAPTKDGKNAFYSSVRDDGYGGSDIYVLDIPEVLHHEEQAIDPNVTYAIKVYDESNNLVDASLILQHEDGNDKLLARRKALGEYNVISGGTKTRLFSLTVTSEGFQMQKISLKIPPIDKVSFMIDKEIHLVREVLVVDVPPPPPPPPPPVEVKPIITSKKLRNVYFDFNKSVIKTEYNEKITKAIDYLKSHPKEKLLLVGHSDLIGAEGRNTTLSKQRAANVKKEMVKKGISSSRIQTKGMGSTQPLASNDQETEGRELNRRVEFKVIR